MRRARSAHLAALMLMALLSLGCDPEVRNLKLPEAERLSKSLVPLMTAA